MENSSHTELVRVLPSSLLPPLPSSLSSTEKPFIQANTVASTLEEVKLQHIIPVFIKDNEPLISHSDFIEATIEGVTSVLPGYQMLQPSVRLSHPIKGRIPEAKLKIAQDLEEYEKTLYYERMAFIIEIPEISDEVDGNHLSLTIGGVKSYSMDNLYGRKGQGEYFKLFIGFQNKVCTNLCVSTDGAQMSVRVADIGQLLGCIKSLIAQYNHGYHLFHLKGLGEASLTEQQFANLLGRCRMYPYLPQQVRNDIQPMLFGDTQVGSIVKDYYRDDSFCKQADGSINLWRLYKLFTNANKSTYIDQFVERSVNAFSLVYSIKHALQKGSYNWYLN